MNEIDLAVVVVVDYDSNDDVGGGSMINILNGCQFIFSSPEPKAHR